MKKCYVVGAGEFFGGITPCKEDLVVAADGGLLHLMKLGIVPDVLVGDFDSLEEKMPKEKNSLTATVVRETEDLKNGASVVLRIGEKNVEAVRYPVMKDKTDMEIAYEIGVSRGYTEFEIYGGVGGREDHTFANYCLLLRAKNDENNAILVGSSAKTMVVKNEKISVQGKCGATVSVFAFGGFASGVNIKGLKYEAENVTLDPASSVGVSNSFVESCEGEISVKSGALLVTVYG